MGVSWAEVHSLVLRGEGLARRGLASLRTRGWRATWERALLQFRPVRASREMRLIQGDRAPFAPFALPGNDSPVASIVIPVFGQVAHTIACLRAIAAHPPRIPFEVIVVDDASPDETPDLLQQIGGLRYHRRMSNGGFIAACNEGFALARGEYLVFLNNDTVPQPGWLEALVATFGEHPRTGLVGAQLIYPDGRLQEAGGVVFRDGSAHNYGRFNAPDDPRFAFVRETDYCSGAALALPRALFARIGGFDPHYAPAYYEDTDLAFAVRAAGYRVLYQPRSRVLHLEGATAGTDTAHGVKAHQPRNREKFRNRWQEALEEHALPGGDLESAALKRHRPRSVLIVDSTTPRPDRDSASLRQVNMMRLLRDEGAHVVFVPLDRAHAGIYTESLQALGIEVWYSPHLGRMADWLRRNGARFDCVLLCRYHLARNLLSSVRRSAPQARIVLDTVDLHHVRERRGAEIIGNPALLRSAERTRRLELETVARSDATLVVSEAEQTLLASEAPSSRVEVLSNLHEVNGPGLPFADRRDLVFVGGFRHPPNVDAVRWFVGEVFPLVREAFPAVRFHCIGDDVPPEIAALSHHEGVQVHGHVPDIAPYMDGVRIAVAPLRFGAGVKGKVNLSMAHGQPVVATSCAVEGMHLRPDEDVLVADEPRAFADAVVRLYGDAALWQRLAGNGLRNVSRHFSLEAGREVVRRVLLQR